MRKPGLWFSATKVEVEDVKKAHRKGCVSCGLVPTGRRLKVVCGTARAQTTDVYCSPCGQVWIERHKEEADRALASLRGSEEPIRV